MNPTTFVVCALIALVIDAILHARRKDNAKMAAMSDAYLDEMNYWEIMYHNYDNPYRRELERRAKLSGVTAQAA